jgi:allantoinase
VIGLLIRGGTLVDEHSARRADVLIDDGQVQTVLEPGQQVVADATIDATGLHVLPGAVDAHVHFNEPGRAHWEGFLTGTRAAAAGGITTVCDMPLNSAPPTLDARALADKRAAIADQAVVDYALWGGLVPGSLDCLAGLSEAGVVGVKAFLCDSGLPEYPPLDERTLAEAMRRCASLGLLLALHAEQHDVTHALGEAARASGRRDALAWAHSRPPETEVEAVASALELARATGVRLHFVHLSTAEAARRVAKARAAGMDVTCETCPHYLALDESDLLRLGALAKCAPPLRARAIVDDLWTCLVDGTLDYVASDHSPCPPEMKASDDIWTSWGGINGVQTLLAVLLHEGVYRRGLTLPRLVQLTSANPARRMGLFPRKGALLPGSDADVALVDVESDWTLRAEELLTRWPLSPFVGRDFHGAVRMTLLRARVAYHDEWVARPGTGRPA